MPQTFLIRTSSRFLRDARKRLRQNPELVEVLEGLRVIQVEVQGLRAGPWQSPEAVSKYKGHQW